MKFRFLLGLTMLLSQSVVAAQLPDWQNPRVVEVNRYPMTATFETDGNKLSLNGVWDFKWYETLEQRDLDFFQTDYDASGWDTMPVPGMWQLNGYGDPLYVNVGYAWRTWYENTPPIVPTRYNHA
jgi:beta-galactosidase